MPLLQRLRTAHGRRPILRRWLFPRLCTQRSAHCSARFLNSAKITTTNEGMALQDGPTLLGPHNANLLPEIRIAVFLTSPPDHSNSRSNRYVGSVHTFEVDGIAALIRVHGCTGRFCTTTAETGVPTELPLLTALPEPTGRTSPFHHGTIT